MAAIANALMAVGGFGLSRHHKKAVARENNVLSAALPKADNAIGNVLDAVAGGRLSPAEASAKLDSVLSTYLSDVSGIIKRTGGKCNAACVYYNRLQEKVASAKGQLASLVPPASTQPASTRGDAPPIAGRFGEPTGAGNVQAFRATPAAPQSLKSSIVSDRQSGLDPRIVWVIGGVVALAGIYLIVRAFSQ